MREAWGTRVIDFENLRCGLQNFVGSNPFDHCVVDGFFDYEVACALAAEFPDYESEDWYFYNNAIEHKKALNNWEKFPKATYQAFTLLQSPAVTELLEETLGEKIYVDHGLNGGGWHIHGSGGNLNPHLDYSIHPKMAMERVLNIIVYLSPELKPEHGGHLGLWAHDEENSAPGALVKEVEPRFNRAIIFNTTQNSWHGMSRKLEVPAGVHRKSLAIYYMRTPADGAEQRGRALFAPRAEQQGDEEVLRTIKLRSNVATSSNVYRT
jgi:Rps23 Pro-64 3,4-dihydroxylase Tpa1-like proline 4-hydroxylase